MMIYHLFKGEGIHFIFSFPSGQWLIDFVGKVERRTSGCYQLNVRQLVCDEFKSYPNVFNSLCFIYDNSFIIAEDILQTRCRDVFKKCTSILFVSIEPQYTFFFFEQMFQ